MTQALDGARFRRALATGTTTVYALEFKHRRRGYVTCLWTTRGSREVTVDVGGRSARLVSHLGRESAVALRRGVGVVPIATAPVFLHTSRPIDTLVPAAPVYAELPADTRSVQVSSFDALTDWREETERSGELENYNFMGPRRKGNFSYRSVPELAGRSGVVGVLPQPAEGPEFLRMYSVLKLKKPVPVPDKPTEIGIWVHGNGGWGRVVFELTDAAGQRWISLGAEMGGEPNRWMADWMPPEEFEKLKGQGKAGLSDWNSNDAWGRSYINHEGWRYVRFPLPGQFGANSDRYHWPASSQWRYSGDGKVTYPLTVAGLAVTVPEKVLYLDRYEAVPEQEIFLDDLQVTYGPVPGTYDGE
jgi:hypothetical protein